MNDLVVIFAPGKMPSINHGVNAADYKGRTDVAINPVYPKDSQGHVIPPDLWTLKNGVIAGGSTMSTKTPANLKSYILGALSGILLSVVYCYLRKIL